MSHEMMAWAIPQRVGRPDEKLALIALADGAGPDGFIGAVSAYRAVGRFCEIDGRAARWRITALVDRGLVARIGEDYQLVARSPR